MWGFTTLWNSSKAHTIEELRNVSTAGHDKLLGVSFRNSEQHELLHSLLQDLPVHKYLSRRSKGDNLAPTPLE